MRVKILFVEENMIDVNDNLFLRQDVPYEVNPEGWVESDRRVKLPLGYLWVDFRVIHKTIK